MVVVIVGDTKIYDRIKNKEESKILQWWPIKEKTEITEPRTSEDALFVIKLIFLYKVIKLN